MNACKINGCEKPRDRQGFCQMHHWRLRNYGDALYIRPKRICRVSDCGRPHKAYGLCSLHHLRKKHGVPMGYSKPILAKKRYRYIRLPGHILADKLGRVAAHRKALFDTTEGNICPCFWCGERLVWKVNLFVDHRDHDRHNNEPENLVPSCNSCNAGRTSVNSHIRTSIYHLPVGEFVWKNTMEAVGS